jgi:glyoxylase-like metal-dependent hydrolase (beta-lactamase superfamily II)
MMFCFQSYVLRTEHHNILVDSCIGNDKNRPHRPTWHRRQGSFLADLARLGVEPEEIDFVLCTHLHGDHVGWNTQLVDGRWVPTFPNAKYIMARTECDFWEQRYREAPDEPRNYAFGDSVLPVLEANRAVLVDTDHEISSGVWFEPAPGHTPGNVVVNVKSNGAAGVLLGDTIHHVLQILEPDWSTFVCEDKAAARASRRAILEKYVDTETLIAPAHFPTPTLGRIVGRDGGFGYRMVDE